MRYIIDRLKEPGTMRSLAVVLFALTGIVPNDAMLDVAVYLLILALGGISAAMPEKASQVLQETQAAVEQTANVAKKVEGTVATAATRVESASATMRDAAQKIRTAVAPNVTVFGDKPNEPR